MDAETVDLSPPPSRRLTGWSIHLRARPARLGAGLRAVVSREAPLPVAPPL